MVNPQSKAKDSLPGYRLERAVAGKVAGIDEVGRGPLAGPVVAACVYIPREVRRHIPGINDSKKLSAKKREALDLLIRQHCHVGMGLVDVEVIDHLNILQASKLAMMQAYQAMEQLMEMVLVDGNQPIQLACPVQTVVRGDAISCSIAAASIVAKVARDRLMQQLHEDYPHYGWNSNAGYGTATHLKALLHHGVTPHHRRSFAPIREVLAINLGRGSADLSQP